MHLEQIQPGCCYILFGNERKGRTCPIVLHSALQKCLCLNYVNNEENFLCHAAESGLLRHYEMPKFKTQQLNTENKLKECK